MKILELDLKNQKLRLIPEDVEDLYYLTLIVRKGDIIRAWTKRSTKIEREFGSERGEKIRVYLGIRVEDMEFSEFVNRLRVKGIIIEAPEDLHVKGCHHTILVSPGKEIVIEKEIILNFELELLKRSVRPRSHAVVLSVGDDYSVIGILGIGGVVPLVEIANKYRKSLRTESLRLMYESYLGEVVSYLKRVIKRYEATVVIILSPTLLRDWLLEVLRKGSIYEESDVRVFKVSEGGLAGIYEFLRSDVAQSMLKEARLMYEQRQVNEVYERLVKDPLRVVVGFNEVKVACEMGAIDRLIILDKLVRTLPENEDLMSIIRRVESFGGKVIIISERGEAGAKLKSLGGLVALTRFKLDKSTFY